FFSSRRRHTRFSRDWSSDVCSSDLILGFVAAIFSFYILAPVVNWVTGLLSSAVEFLVTHNLLPLTSILIEPAKVFFLNNAINHRSEERRVGKERRSPRLL